MPNEVTLHVNGKEISGWDSVRITKSLEQLAHEFELGLTNSRIGTITKDDVLDVAGTITQDDEVRVDVDGQTVITGYVSRISLNYDSDSVAYRVAGESKTIDLIDSSVIRKGHAWADAALSVIALDLCEGQDIQVSVAGDESPNFKRFRCEPGERRFEALSRLCEMRGFLPTTGPDGGLEILRASDTPSGAVIELGVNVLRCEVERSNRERFSAYLFKGQTSASDDWSGKEASQLKGEVEDSGVSRYRPLVILGPKQRTKDDLGKRAVWERNVRAGRSLRARYRVPGWFASNGQLWEPNLLVTVKDDWSEINQDMLVTRVDLTLADGEDEHVAQLELMDRAAFDIL